MQLLSQEWCGFRTAPLAVFVLLLRLILATVLFTQYFVRLCLRSWLVPLTLRRLEPLLLYLLLPGDRAIIIGLDFGVCPLFGCYY